MSELGSGIVVPLVKLAEHFSGWQAARVREALAWQDMPPIEREPLIKAVLDGEPSPWAAIVAYTARVDIEVVIHDAITSWVNVASDLVLDINQKKSPPLLKELQAVLDHLRTVNGIFLTGNDWSRVRRLFIDAVVELDRDILEVEADWGEI